MPAKAATGTSCCCLQLLRNPAASRCSALATWLQALVVTAARQREAKLLEEVEGGKYKLRVGDPGQLPGEVDKAQRKQGRVMAAVRELQREAPQVAGQLARALAHAAGGGGSGSGGGGSGSSLPGSPRLAGPGRAAAGTSKTAHG